MTEKDWIKCRSFVGKEHWVLATHTQLDPGFEEDFFETLNSFHAFSI
jgi:tetraacyldisaccharide-1-P 4'-kinase